VISHWHDRRINPGIPWKSAIHEQLNLSHIILLLISADFLASDYCYDVEMKRAMELHETGRARVIPIILRPCDWQQTPFAKLQALPTDGRPVINWAKHDSAFIDIARGIREVVNSFRIKNLESEVEKIRKVLVVDDERVTADTIAIILNQNGYQAITTYTGNSAVEIAKRERPSLVLSDVIMPGLNGIEAAIRIQQLVPDCHILLFSGQAATAALLEKARQAGHQFEVLAKPIHPQDLLAKLRNDPPDVRERKQGRAAKRSG
jgi:CheY-like chemotaxis protein